MRGLEDLREYITKYFSNVDMDNPQRWPAYEREEPYPTFDQHLNQEPKPFIELRRELGDDLITVVDQTGNRFTYDLTEEPFSRRKALNHRIDLDEAELERMIDHLWSFGLVIFWPERQTERWEVL